MMMPYIVCMLGLIAVHDEPGTGKQAISPERIACFQRAVNKAVFTALPTPLYEGSDHWGDTKKTINGVKWKGAKPEWQYADKPHGTWRKYRVTLNQPAEKHLRLQVSQMKRIGNNTLSIQIVVNADIDFDVTQQNWQSGVKLFDGSASGRATVELRLTFESALTVEPGASFMPILKYRLKVTEAKASYHALTFTHVPGLGGSAAKLIGDWTVDVVNQLKPSLERKLIDKLTQKIVKSADTKEIQVSLSGIERKK